MIRCVDRTVIHMQTNAFWNLLRAGNMQNRTFMFLLKENVGIQEVRCIFFDCLASYLAYLWNAMRLKQRVGYIEHINEGDLNNIATFCKLKNNY